MGSINEQLSAGEKVVYRAKMHWLRYGKAAACLFFGGYLWVTTEASVLAPMLVLAGALLAGYAFLDVLTAEFVVTNRRVFLQRGILRRQSVEVLLGKVESIIVDQTLLGRLLDYGSIYPGGAGGTRQPFTLIANPMAFRQRVNAEIEALQPATTAALSPA